MNNIQLLTTWLKAKNNGLHHRQLLIIELPHEQYTPLIDIICAHYCDITAMINEHTKFTCQASIDIEKYQKNLGNQTNALIFDATNGFHLNALYAGAGMVRKNGIVVILLNPNNMNYSFRKGVKYSFGQQDAPSLFVKLFKGWSSQFNTCFIDAYQSNLPSSIVVGKQGVIEDPVNLSETSCSKESVHELASYEDISSGNISAQDSTIELSSNQVDIAEKVISTICANQYSTQSISVILGARGRGKSTLLGVIAAKLAIMEPSSNKEINIAVCALHFNQLTTMKYAFERQYEETSDQFSVNTLVNHKKLAFYAPDEIVGVVSQNTIVFIDEIASIAPELLKIIISHFPHIVLAGTTSGYEGSGNGFMLRILPHLCTTKSTKIYELKQAFRWLENDPIEACLTSMLGTGVTTEKDLPYLAPLVKLEDICFRLIDKHEFINDKRLYDQIFTLLSHAHYQTTPNDIVRTLDANECKIFAALINSSDNTKLPVYVIAVAIVFEEGGAILAPISHDISMGKRRVQGHLTAQALSLQLFSPQACTSTFFRINRIAVNNLFLRKGIASRLLNCCQQWAEKMKIDYMSVSFGYTHWLYCFWQNNDYILAKLGERIDSASGSPSVLLIKPISKLGSIDLSEIDARIGFDLEYYSHVNKKLADLYYDLSEKKCALVTAKDTEMLDKLFVLFIKKHINFKKFAPALLQLIKHRRNDIANEKNTRIYEIFTRLHQKGVHKEEKIELEIELRIELASS